MIEVFWVLYPFIIVNLLMKSLNSYKCSKESNDLYQCIMISVIGAMILYFIVPFHLIHFNRVIFSIFFVIGIFTLLPQKRGSMVPFALFLITFSILFMGSNTEFKHKWVSAKDHIHTFVEQTRMPEEEKQLSLIHDQKNMIERRLEREIPDFTKLLYKQANEIKDELRKSPSPSSRVLLMDELDEIARTLLVLEKDEEDYRDLLFELASNERTLVRLKESEKLFGPEYDKFLEESRNAMIKAKAKLNIKLDNALGNTTLLQELEVKQKIEQLLNE